MCGNSWLDKLTTMGGKILRICRARLIMRVRVQAFAKINLALEVLGRREDGYHEVKSILQTIDLADRLEVQPYPVLRVDCDDPALGG